VQIKWYKALCLATKKGLNSQEAQGAICQKGENIIENEGYLIGGQFFSVEIGKWNGYLIPWECTKDFTKHKKNYPFFLKKKMRGISKFEMLDGGGILFFETPHKH
jgi:hypothetical protein